MNTSILILFAALQAGSQLGLESTRFTITGAPILSQPRQEFGSNVGNSFGAEAGVLYHLDRAGWFSVRLDVSGFAYGHEKKRAPLSQTIGERIIVDVTTTNSITALSFAPEFSLPHGPVRPYVNAGLSALFFRTTSSVGGTGSEENAISTKNHSDSTGAPVFGAGVRIPIALPRAHDALSLDTGIRYYRGGTVSYLREGSIQDNPNGTITITPLMSRTPYIVYMIGLRVRIPHNPSKPCARLLC